MTPTEAPAAKAASRTFSALQNNRDFRYLWLGDFFFNAAQWLEFITVGWLALEVTQSSLHSVLAVGVRAAPILFVGPWAGVIADRWDRRRLAIGATLLTTTAALAFGLALARARPALDVWHIYAYMVISGIGVAVAQPVRQALITNTVPRSDLANAQALNSMTVTSMRLSGTLIGGILIESVAFHWNFLIEAGMYLITTLLLLPMRTPYREGTAPRDESIVANLVAGVRYLLRQRLLRRLNILNLTRTALFVPLLLLLPGYTRDVLAAGATVNVAMTVSMGIGGLLATFIISSRGFFARPGLVVLITLISGSSVILGLGLSRWIWLSVPIMVVMGLSQTHFIVSNLTLIQSSVPDELRGRMASVWYYEQGLVPLFAAAIGFLAASTGLRFAFVAMGAGGLALGLLYLLHYRDVRTLGVRL